MRQSAFPNSARPPVATPVRGWQPDTAGLPQALALSASLVALLMGGLVLLAGRIVPPPPEAPVTVQLMDSPSAMAIPAVAAVPPAPEMASPPPATAAAAPPPAEAQPLPALSAPVPPAILAPPPVPSAATMPDLAPPADVPSLIAIPPPASPPVLPRRAEPPRPHPQRRVERARPAPRAALAEPAMAVPERPIMAAPPPVAAPPAPADIVSGLGPYRAGLHRQIERNMLNDRAVGRLGVSGTAVIEATIAPEGRVISARLARSSGIRAIDEAALGAVQRGGFPAFGPHMPAAPITVSVPIGVEAD